MSQNPNALRYQFLTGSALLLAGLIISGAGAVALRTEHAQIAQATPGAPNNTDGQTSTQKDVRPTTPAPEPARPSDSTTGASSSSPAVQPPLPPAPAEKSGTPIPEKK